MVTSQYLMLSGESILFLSRYCLETVLQLLQLIYVHGTQIDYSTSVYFVLDILSADCVLPFRVFSTV